MVHSQWSHLHLCLPYLFLPPPLDVDVFVSLANISKCLCISFLIFYIIGYISIYQYIYVVPLVLFFNFIFLNLGDHSIAVCVVLPHFFFTA